MKSVASILLILVLGFAVYWFLKDSIFEPTTESVSKEGFEHPAKAPIQIRQAPIYPERTVSPSGPNPPNQSAPSEQIVIHSDPTPQDPYNESQESSDIPENLRYPERSFRAPPLNNNTQIAVEAGIASHNQQISHDNSQQYSTDFLQNGGEFMNGIFANDTMVETNFSAF
jgi:hypothetical protein